jgi:hypothetical protein
VPGEQRYLIEEAGERSMRGPSNLDNAAEPACGSFGKRLPDYRTSTDEDVSGIVPAQ